MSGTQKNEGEGNRTAAKQYDDAQTKFAQSGKVNDAAQRAKKAIDPPEGEELRKAEDIGRKAADHQRQGQQRQGQQRQGQRPR